VGPGEESVTILRHEEGQGRQSRKGLLVLPSSESTCRRHMGRYMNVVGQSSRGTKRAVVTKDGGRGKIGSPGGGPEFKIEQDMNRDRGLGP